MTKTIHKTSAIGRTEQLTEVLNKQAEVNAAVAEAGDLPKLTAKQIEKQQKQEKAYWNSMISRQEALQLVRGAIAQEQEKTRALYISVNTLVNVLKDKGMVNDEELNAATKKLLESIYNPEPEAEPAEADKKEEATDGGKENV